MRWHPFIIVGVIVGASILTRGLFLTHPTQVVFDEVHFGKFVSAYCCTHERFFDIHPPHAKLLVAAVVSLTSYDGSFPFAHIGQPYGQLPVMIFRLVPVVAGALLPLVVYGIVRLVGASRRAGLLGALAVVFDNALIVQSRVISLDAVLLLAIFGALLCILAARKFGGWRQWSLVFLAGAAAGLAVGSKFTGIVALGLVGLFLLVDVVRVLLWRTPGAVVRQLGLGGVTLVGFLVVYLGGWVIHFALLTEPGSGDAWRVPVFMVGEQGGIAWVLLFWQEVVAWHRLMLSANYGLDAGHPDASPWWSWPLLLRPVFYWTSQTAAIYLFGNPVVWWGSTVVIVVAAWYTVRHWYRRFLGRVRAVRTGGTAWILGVGYVAALFPLTRVPRALFLYHYFTALIFAVLIAAVWLDRRGAWRSWRIMMVALVLLVAGWLWVSPITYGWATPAWWHSVLGELPRWY